LRSDLVLILVLALGGLGGLGLFGRGALGMAATTTGSALLRPYGLGAPNAVRVLLSGSCLCHFLMRSILDGYAGVGWKLKMGICVER